MEEKKEIYPGVYEVTRTDGSKIITGDGWATHIHNGEGWFNVKVEKTNENFKGFKDFNGIINKYLPGWMK